MSLPRAVATLALPALVASTLGGCAWGMRGGFEVAPYTRGPVLVQPTVTGFAGFGSTHRDGSVNDGVVITGTFAAGGDATRGGWALSYVSGLEWFNIAEAGRWGWHAGFEAGARGRERGPTGGEALVGLRGGPLVRLVSRATGEGKLITLGLDLTFHGVLPFERDHPDAGFALGVGLTLGFADVHPFHL